MERLRAWGGTAAWTALLALALHPLFLTIFRLMIFNTFPRDDYAPMLLGLLGAPGGAPLESPYGYRALSMLAAAPFYYLLPPPGLTNMPSGLAAEYVKATAAMAAVSYLALVLSCVAAYRLVIDRFALGRAEAVFAALFVLVAQFYASPFSVDPLAIFVVILALYFIERPVIFAAILLVSVVVNEKIAIVFFVWLTIRCVLGARAVLGRQWLAAVAAIVAYAAMLFIVRMPGHGEQLDPGVYLPTVIQNVTATVTTMRGLLFNIVPVALLLAAAAWSWKALGWQRNAVYSRLDLLAIPGLMIVALMLTQYFQVGRIVMHGAPLFLWPVTQAFALWVRRDPRQARW